MRGEPRDAPGARQRAAATALAACFFLRGGLRVAVRLVAPPAALALAGAGFLGPGFLESAGRTLLPPEAGPSVGTAVLALLFLLLARVLRSRLVAGEAWLRSLPIGARGLHHARLLATTAGIAPAAAAVAVLFLATASSAEAAGDSEGRRSPAITVAGLAAAPVGAAAATAPLRTPAGALGAGALGALGLLGLLSGSVPALAIGTVLAGAAALVPAGRVRITSPRARRRFASRCSPLPLPWLRVLRAAGARRWAESWLPAALCFGGAAAFAVNNELPPGIETVAWRLGAGSAIALHLASIGSTLQRRLAPWSWSRSLPVASSRRVAADVALFATSSLIVLAPFLATRATPALLSVLWIPYLSARAAGVVRQRGERFAGSATLAFAIEAEVLIALSALVPWLALLGPVLTTPALGWATESERRRRVLASELHASDGVLPAA